jgi:MFS family permease
MTGLLIITCVVTFFYTPEDEKLENDKTEYVKQHHEELHTKFNSFRRQYLSVFLIIMLADWLQGTHMYTLYLSYNVNISALFLTGFLSGAIFAPFLGSAVDKFGRKRSCIVYCVLEIVINIMEHSTNFHLLLFGRVLGGISTNLLFSAFESWMTTEHRHQGFPEEWLTRTYAEASIGNGSMAILAGIVAQVLEDYLGHIGPFQGAIALTAIALLLILRWNENYGEKKEGEHSQSSLYHQFTEGWKVTMSDSNVWRIGMTQALSEGAMYTVRTSCCRRHFHASFRKCTHNCRRPSSSLYLCGFQRYFHSSHRAGFLRVASFRR